MAEVLSAGGAACAYSHGEFLSAETILADAALLTRQALNAMAAPDGVSTLADCPDPGAWARGLTAADFANAPTSRARAAAVTTPQFLIAQTAAVDILTTVTSGRDLMDTWLSRDRAKQLVDRLRISRLASSSVHLDRLLGWRRPEATAITDCLGRRRSQHSARALYSATSEPIDAMNLPACLWPQVRDHAPDMPDRVSRLFPLTAPIALAAMGRRVDYAVLAAEFGYEYSTSEVRYALNHLISNENGTAVFDYLCQLHAHLRAHPPPIDYRRRRRLFPAPAEIGRNHTRQLARAGGMYLTDAFTWKIQRYVWQLLTGNDPLVSRDSGD